MSLVLDPVSSDVPACFSNIGSDAKFHFLASFEEITDYETVDGRINLDSIGRKQNPPIAVKKRKSMRHSEQKPNQNLLTNRLKKDEQKGRKTKKRKVEVDLHSSPTSHAKCELEREVVPCNREESYTEDTTLEGMESWDGLYVPIDIQRALMDIGFTQPTPIQRLVLPSAIRDKLDILGAAETGSGKTLAFAIPIIAGLIADQNNGCNGIKALIITPTRELAMQIKDHIKVVLKYLPMKVCCVIGGMSIQKQERLVKKSPEIVVATPGRLWQLAQETECLDLTNLKYVAIDETDRMVERGHFEELTHILHLVNETSNVRQSLVFSATLTYVHPAPRRVGANYKKDLTPKQKLDSIISATGMREQRKVLDITRQFGTAETLTECRINCDHLQEKDAYLYYFLASYPGRTLIFCNSIDCCRRLHGILSTLKLCPYLIHAKMQQKQRLKNLEKFTASSRGVLLGTDVAARGLDIRGVQHVVHYQIPRTAEIYVHRSGRTARANCEGVSIMLVDPNEAHLYTRICRNLNRDEDLSIFPVKNRTLLSLLKERLKLATLIESVEHKDKKHKAKANWFHRAAASAELELDESLIDADQGDVSMEMRNLRKKLDCLLKEKVGLNETEKRTKYPTFDMVQGYGAEGVSALDQAKNGHMKRKKTRNKCNKQ